MLSIISEYEQTLMGEKVKVSPSFFRGDKITVHNNALEIFRYAFSEILKWEPEEIQRNISRDILEKLKLDVIYDRFIIFPVELDKNDDMHYLAHLMYPDKVKYPVKNLALAVLKRVDEKGKKFPKFYFSTEGGMDRACFALSYMINKHMWGYDIKEYYEFFANKTKAEKFLKKHHLFIASNTHFASPLDYFHYSLNAEQQDEFYYYYHKFNDYWERLNFSKHFLAPIENGNFIKKGIVDNQPVYSYLTKEFETKTIPREKTEIRMCFDDETPFANDFEFNTNHKVVIYIPEEEFEKLQDSIY